MNRKSKFFPLFILLICVLLILILMFSNKSDGTLASKEKNVNYNISQSEFMFTANSERTAIQERDPRISYSWNEEYMLKSYEGKVQKQIALDNLEIKVEDCLFQRSEQGDLIDIEIYYPQVRMFCEGEDMSVITNKINKQIYEYVVLSEYVEWMDCRYNRHIRYAISCLNEQYISIVFEGNHENAPSTLNFNLKNGEIVCLEDIISLEELRAHVCENSEVIVEGERIETVGGREGVISYLETYVQDGDYVNQFAITDTGIKLIVYNEFGDYYIAEIMLEK